METVLFTARDAGAAGHIAAIANAVAARGRPVCILAQDQALEALKGDARCRDSTDVIGEIAEAELPDASLLRKTAEFLQEINAAAVVNGMSTFGCFGVDETVFLAAKRMGLPTFAAQDFWGDAERVDGATADHIFVLDDFAAALTRPRVDGAVHVVGSCRHAAKRAIDPSRVACLRAAAGARGGEPVIAFFGQNLLDMEGYRRLLCDFAECARLAAPSARIMFRPHPRENEASASNSIELLCSAGVEIENLPRTSVDTAVAAADIVVSAFSTIGLDAVYQSKQAGALRNVVVYADYPNEIAAFWREQCSLPMADDFPLAAAGYALSARDKTALGENIAAAFDQTVRARIEAAILDRLPDATGAANRAAAVIDMEISDSVSAMQPDQQRTVRH